jgi:hypothetical protein
MNLSILPLHSGGRYGDVASSVSGYSTIFLAKIPVLATYT